MDCSSINPLSPNNIPPDSSVPINSPTNFSVTADNPPGFIISGENPPDTTLSGVNPDALLNSGYNPPDISNPGQILAEISLPGENLAGLSVPGEDPSEFSNSGENPGEFSNSGENPADISLSGENPVDISNSGENPDNNNIDNTVSSSDPVVTESGQPVDSSQPPPKKRRRRKKQFPEMISSAAAVSGLRVMRPKTLVPAEEFDDEGDFSLSKSKRRRNMSDLAKEVDVEALIAISVGFPVDSLTEEEIEANVVSQVGGIEQANYIVVRNHILARWRSNVDVWLTKDHALESIRAEHKSLVNSAYGFLLNHGYINFGISPNIKDVKAISFDGKYRGDVVVIGAGLSGLAAARQLVFWGLRLWFWKGGVGLVGGLGRNE